jgi:hypothetical protein
VLGIGAATGLICPNPGTVYENVRVSRTTHLLLARLLFLSSLSSHLLLAPTILVDATVALSRVTFQSRKYLTHTARPVSHSSHHGTYAARRRPPLPASFLPKPMKAPPRPRPGLVQKQTRPPLPFPSFGPFILHWSETHLNLAGGGR